MDPQRLHFGILGTGFISDYHIHGLQAAGAQVDAIFGRDQVKGQKKANKYNIPFFTTDYRALLSKKDINAVVIATPDHTHAKLAQETAEAGKAILLQKPMARNSEECQLIINTARQCGVPLLVSWMHRYLEEVIKLRELINQGVFGSIKMVRIRNATIGPNWAAWFFDKEKVGGGVVVQLGVHGIDLVRQLFGEINEVKAITASSHSERILADGTKVIPNNEDIAIAIYNLACGTIVSHEFSFSEIAGTDRFRIEVYGDLGTAWLRTERGILSIYAPGFAGSENWGKVDLPLNEDGFRHHKHIIDMLCGAQPVDASAQDGLASLLTAEAIYRSSLNCGASLSVT